MATASKGPIIEIGDVVHVCPGGTPAGFAVVAGIEAGNERGRLLKLHDGHSSTPYHYMHEAWCRTVGRATPGILAMAEAADREYRDLQAERRRRHAEAEAAELAARKERIRADHALAFGDPNP